MRGANTVENFKYANNLLRRVRLIPGVADARIQQSPSSPAFNVDVDRTRAQYVGLTARDVTNSMVVNLAGSSQVAPTFFLDPNNGVSYSIVMQTPQYQIDSLSKLEALPISGTGAPTAPMLGGIAEINRSASSAVVSQYDIQTMVRPRREGILARSPRISRRRSTRPPRSCRAAAAWCCSDRSRP